ncbi:MAG: YbaY family lipoprotein [Thermoanaerobaculia bacterium]|jgi:putative lipoprotein
MKIARTVALLALSLVALSCASTDQKPDEMGTVTGTLSYLERIALSPEAKAQIRIVDLDRLDKPGYLVAEKSIESPGQVPIPFELIYWMERVESGHTYALQARIEEGGKVIFKTAEDVKFDAKQPSKQELTLSRAE